MMQILLVSSDDHFFPDLTIQGQDRLGIRVSRASSGKSALLSIQMSPFDLVVADEELPDMTGLAFLRRVVTENPMLNCAAVSGLSPEAFHETSEGLGILMQLPRLPQIADMEKLAVQLKKVLSLANDVG